MDKKDFIYDVTSALESAPEASLEGEVRGTWMSTRSPPEAPSGRPQEQILQIFIKPKYTSSNVLGFEQR